MFVRHDILQAMGLQVPNTWEELLDVAAVVNGTEMNGDGLGDMAICFTRELSTDVSYGRVHVFNAWQVLSTSIIVSLIKVVLS